MHQLQQSAAAPKDHIPYIMSIDDLDVHSIPCMGTCSTQGWQPTDTACLLQDLAFGKVFTDHMLVVSPAEVAVILV
jgi:hypothetical protein